MDTSHNKVQMKPGIVISWRRGPVIAVRWACMSESLS